MNGKHFGVSHSGVVQGACQARERASRLRLPVLLKPGLGTEL